MKPDCYTLLYAPSTSAAVQAIIGNISANNVPPIPASKVMGFANIELANLWMQTGDNFVRTLGVYEFFVAGNELTHSVTSIDFGIQFVRPLPCFARFVSR